MKKILIICLLASIKAISQPAERLIKVFVAPDKEDWTYSKNEEIKFTVAVYKNGSPVKNAKIYYTYGAEKMKPVKEDSMILTNGIGEIRAGKYTEAGFYRCIAFTRLNNIEYRGLGTAAVEPLSIKPVVTMPQDFNKFWADAKADLAKIPLDSKMTLLPERCTEKVNVYHVSLANFKTGGQSRLYGILAIPKAQGKYPALLKVPGAGARPYAGDVKTAEKGIITFEIGIHGVPVNLDVSIYNDMLAGWLNQYWNYNLDHKDYYYYKRVYLGCVRANDFLVGLPQFDGVNLAVAGGSQGGALSIVTAALDSRVKYTAPTYPALADMAGYTANRAGGWPHIFDQKAYPQNKIAMKEKLETASYYDVVNFAKQLTVPVFYSMGYNDETCPPTSMYAAYNSINAPKTLKLFLETGHWTFPEENEAISEWLVSKLIPKK